MKIIIKDNSRALWKEESDIKSVAPEDLRKEIVEQGEPIRKVKKNALLDKIRNDMKISKVELKQHFINKGEFDNAQKTEAIHTENPKETAKTIKNELSFFGASFLEGFLGVYGIKLDNALSNYEDGLMILPEYDIGSQKRTDSIYQVVKGNLEKRSEHNSLADAQKRLQEMQQSQIQPEIKNNGGLRHEIKHETEN